MRTQQGATQQDIPARAGRVFPGGVMGTFTLPPDLDFIPVRGAGTRVWDLSGREYLDYVLGGGPMFIGHCHPEVVAAIQAQAAKGLQFYGGLNEPILALAEEITRAVPNGERIRFGTSGSEATFYALRLARAFTGRDKILKFEGGYHGHNDYAYQSVTPKHPPDFPQAVPETAGIPGVLRNQLLVAPFNDLERTADIIRRHRATLAAVIVEPVQRALRPQPGFLSGLREVTASAGVCLVFDEVVTGFRLAFGGAQEAYGVTADLTTYGKIIGGGLPLSAICGRAEILDLCDPARKGTPGYVYQSGTLNGNPVAAAAGLATLRVLRSPEIYAQTNRRARRLREGLQAIAGRLGIEALAIGEGPLWNLLFTAKEPTCYRDLLLGDAARQRQFHLELIRRGVWVIPGNRSYFSTVHTDEDVERTLEASEDALKVLRTSIGPSI